VAEQATAWRSDSALAREGFINELRRWLGLEPLYGYASDDAPLQVVRPTLAHGLTPLSFHYSFARYRRHG